MLGMSGWDAKREVTPRVEGRSRGKLKLVEDTENNYEDPGILYSIKVI